MNQWEANPFSVPSPVSAAQSFCCPQMGGHYVHGPKGQTGSATFGKLQFAEMNFDIFPLENMYFSRRLKQMKGSAQSSADYLYTAAKGKASPETCPTRARDITP